MATKTANLAQLSNTFDVNSSGAVSVGGSTGTSGQVLTSQGSGAAPQWLLVSPVMTTTVFTSSGSWTCPSGVTKARVTVVGGGGSAASQVSQSGTGGGGGGAAIKVLTVSPGTTYTVTVGAGGAGLSAGGGNRNGNAGGTSSFSGSGISTVSATGGSAGAGAGGSAAGGIGSGGDLNIRGGMGSGSYVNNSTPPSYGGSTMLCGTTPAGTTPVYGGGSGGTFNDAGSAAGADGVVIVEY